MISDMLQFGLGANPTFVDYNGDDLLDIVVGNQRYNSSDISNLFLLENIGTATAPAYELVDNDYLGFKELFSTSTINFNFAPTFGDLDNDGDEDMLVGDNSGALLYAENTAGPGNVFQFGPIQGQYMGIDVGQMSTPQIIDLDRDGLPDIVIGEKTINVSNTDPEKVGNIHFYKNIGTPENPLFDPDPEAAGNTQFLGRVNTLVVSPSGSNSGEAAPVFYDYETDFLLFTGSSSGQVMVYDQVEADLYGAFREVNRDYGDLNIGVQSRIDIADINSDGLLDMVVGNKRGGINIFTTTYNVNGTVGTREPDRSLDFALYPNPAESNLQLEWSTGLSQKGTLSIYDALGRLTARQAINGGSASLNVAPWTPGLYFVELRVGEFRGVRKFVVK